MFLLYQARLEQEGAGVIFELLPLRHLQKHALLVFSSYETPSYKYHHINIKNLLCPKMCCKNCDNDGGSQIKI